MISPIRTGGMVSGLDTESIIKKLMSAEKAPLNKLLQKKQTEEWKRDQYREMNNLFLDFRKATQDLRLQSSFQKKAVSSDNEAIVSAKQKGVPNLTSYDVNVTSLATSAKAASVKFTTNMTNDTTAIGEAFDFKVGASATTINVLATDTVSSVISKVNSASATTGVTASYFSGDKSITFTSTATGSGAAVTIGLVGADFGPSNKLNLSAGTVNNGAPTGFGTASGTQSSADAVQGNVKINGINYATSGSTVNFDGIEFNLKSVGTTKVNVKPDEDAIFNSIKGLVDKYNDLISKVNGKLTEPSYKDYQPLLDDQRAAMSDKQIEQWETKAKSGLLRRDSMLSDALTDLRKVFSTPIAASSGIDPNFSTISQVGITTGSYMENGKLYLDETKLRDAISKNGTKVMDLFTKVSSSADLTTKFNESGIAQRLYTQLNNSMKALTDKAGSILYLVDKSVLGKELRGIDKDIISWNDRLQTKEDSYWKRFTAMEKAMSKAQSQSSWLSQHSG